MNIGAPAEAGGFRLRVAIVIPAYNEEQNLARLFGELEQHAAEWPFWAKVVFVDDGSSDATVDMLEAYDGQLVVEIVRQDKNRGPGAALLAGFRRVLEDEQVDYIATIEADTTSDLSAMPRMIAAAEAGAEVVQGSMHHPEGHMLEVPHLRRLTSWGANWIMRLATGTKLDTFTNMFRVFNADTLRAAMERRGGELISDPGFAGVTELLLNLCSDGAIVREVPIVLDAGKRADESKMPVWPTVRGQLRLVRKSLWRRLVRSGAGLLRHPGPTDSTSRVVPPRDGLR